MKRKTQLRQALLNQFDYCSDRLIDDFLSERPFLIFGEVMEKPDESVEELQQRRDFCLQELEGLRWS